MQLLAIATHALVFIRINYRNDFKPPGRTAIAARPNLLYS